MPGEIVQVQLTWTTDSPLDTPFVVFVQALDQANHLVGQRDAEPAISSTQWTPGQTVLDRHGVLIEPGTPPGEYRIIVGLYDAVTGQRLPARGGDFVEIERITVERPAAPPPLQALRFRHPVGTDIGTLRLLGYDRYKLSHSHDPDTPLNPGDPLHMVLFWQTHSRPQVNWQVAIELISTKSASPIVQGVFPAAGVTYPTAEWEPEEVVRAQFDIFLPGDVAPGSYQMRLRLLDESGTPERDTIDLASVQVE
jgi:hypothetical protein